MLKTTLNKGEKIYIGEDIVVEIVDLQHYNTIPQVKLGFNAPKNIKIHRKEGYKLLNKS